MADEESRDRDATPPSSLDRLLGRIDAHRSLPVSGQPAGRALGPPTALAEAEGVREPVADVVVTPARMYVTVELPGVSRETLEVTAEDQRLTVHAIAADGRVFHLDIGLDHPVVSESVTATYRNGVLDVTLPRRRGHRVRIKRDD